MTSFARTVPVLAVAALCWACSADEEAVDGGSDAGSMDAGGTDAGVTDAGPDAGADGGADAGDTWTSYAQPFFASYCTRCHAGGGDPSTGDKDFTLYSSVSKYAPHIRCGVAATQDPSWNCGENPRQFPISAPFPDDANRDRLVAWIVAGLPQ